MLRPSAQRFRPPFMAWPAPGPGFASLRRALLRGPCAPRMLGLGPPALGVRDSQGRRRGRLAVPRALGVVVACATGRPQTALRCQPMTGARPSTASWRRPNIPGQPVAQGTEDLSQREHGPRMSRPLANERRAPILRIGTESASKPVTTNTKLPTDFRQKQLLAVCP
jgi:hypothetical protein